MNFANLGIATLETLGMTLISTALAYLVGIPLGICLNITSKNGLHPQKVVNLIIGVIVNLLRSVPCMLLIILLLPITRVVVGRGTGDWYTMLIPLFVASFPFVARMVEQSLAEVPSGEVEAIRSMGANNAQIIRKVLIAEAKPSLISGTAVSAISILGYTSFAYDFAAGGLISSAYSFYNNHTGNYLTYPNVWVIILVVVVIVQLLQEIGLYIARKTDKRRVIA
jgi:D-methionine transport system permease protein